MGLEIQRAFQLEYRRLFWLIGLVFATIILFQRIEPPTGYSLWFMFYRGEVSEQRTNTFLSANTTIGPISLGNTSSPIPRNTSNLQEERNGVYKNNSSSRRTEYQNDTFFRDVPELIYPSENHTSKSNSSSIETHNEGLALPSLQSANFSLTFIEPHVASPRPIALSPSEPPKETILDQNYSSPMISTNGSILSENGGLPQAPPIPGQVVKTKSELLKQEVLTLSDMNELLVQSHLTPNSSVPRWSMKVDEALATARSRIETAPPLNNELYAPLYHNASMFQRSYELMEQMLKVYIYQEGDRRIFHNPPLEGIYASEGWFMKLLETNRHLVTKRPDEVHLFYLPFSSRKLEETLYVPNSHSLKNLRQHLKNYLDMISAKYPFWNRTDGADHFVVACHDWAPSETKRHMSNCIRALCNADVKEGFKFGKDVSLPETYVRNAKNPLRTVGGKAPSKRKTLAFYAGNMLHGYLRPILLQHWGNNKDPDMQIFGKLPNSTGDRNYIDYMKSSKYCICPRGYEVNSPRVVEAIFYECVPVVISDNYFPPFLEALNWESFAVFVAEKDIPNLKNILISIPKKTYFQMHMRVRKVQKHFLWHPKPVKYDLFHMTLHSIWYNRVFQFRQR